MSTIGIVRFEKLLELLGLGGDVEDETKDTLREVRAIRNLFAHQAGVADARFCEQCPTIGVEGQRVKVLGHRLREYIEAVVYYGQVVINRVVRKHDPDWGEDLEDEDDD